MAICKLMKCGHNNLLYTIPPLLTNHLGTQGQLSDDQSFWMVRVLGVRDPTPLKKKNSMYQAIMGVLGCLCFLQVINQSQPSEIQTCQQCHLLQTCQQCHLLLWALPFVVIQHALATRFSYFRIHFVLLDKISVKVVLKC